MKRTSVMAHKEVCKSTRVVGAICGTSSKTIERFYDVPANERKRTVVGLGLAAFVPTDGTVVNDFVIVAPPPTASAQVAFCWRCGVARARKYRMFCPACGARMG